jgi:hypothetical protein
MLKRIGATIITMVTGIIATGTMAIGMPGTGILVIGIPVRL